MNNCGCNYKKYCKSCSYTNPNKGPSEYYDYWNETWWNNWNTTNGWGATKGETQQGLSTGDNLSGYGLVDTFEHLWQYSFDDFVGEDNKETVFAIKYTYKDFGDDTKRDGNRWQVMISLRNKPASTMLVYLSQPIQKAFPLNHMRRNVCIKNVCQGGQEVNQSNQSSDSSVFFLIREVNDQWYPE